MQRRAGSCYKHSTTAENSTSRDSSYIKEGFRLWIRFVETGFGNLEKKKKRKQQMGRGEIVPKTEQVRKNVKVQESAGF